MVIEILYAAFGLALLTFAADHLVLGSSHLAERLRVSPVVIGVVVIGLGTSAPEFLVSGLAAARGDTGIAVGNIVGSNILNLTLLLGIAAIIAPIPVESTVIRREIPLTVAATVLFGVLAVFGLNNITAAALAFAGIVALWALVRWARSARTEVRMAVEAASAQPGHRRAWVDSVRAVLGLLGVLAGAELLVDGAAAVAEHLGVSQTVIGFTLVAAGTSLPELVTSVQAQRRGESGLVVGNLFGSNLFNSLVGGAVIGLAGTGTAHATVVLVLTMILTSGLAWLLLRRGHMLTRPEGVLIVLTYALVASLSWSA
jgi:cation:H+ antiporter